MAVRGENLAPFPKHVKRAILAFDRQKRNNAKSTLGVSKRMRVFLIQRASPKLERRRSVILLGTKLAS